MRIKKEKKNKEETRNCTEKVMRSRVTQQNLVIIKHHFAGVEQGIFYF